MCLLTQSDRSRRVVDIFLVFRLRSPVSLVSITFGDAQFCGRSRERNATGCPAVHFDLGRGGAKILINGEVVADTREGAPDFEIVQPEIEVIRIYSIE